MCRYILILLLSFSITATAHKKTEPRPNVIFIIADDLGWNDVSFHGSDQILTPNIDALAYAGIILNQYRTHCQCTPSRSALLTGKYAHKIGMQGYPLTNGEDRAIPLSEKLLPQYLKELGYSTHLVGKWHVGSSRKSYLPTNRGYDSYFGHLGGFVDYYEYTAEETWSTGKVSGMNLFRNEEAAWDVEGYITDVYTAEAQRIISNHDKSKPLFLQLAHTAPHSGNDGSLLQAPPDVLRKMRHIESPERRTYAAMVKKLDDSISKIVKSLADEDILNNTIIIFSSDNGGMTVGKSMNWASNYPLRGIKMSPWEGGIRTIGLVWAPNMIGSHHIWNGNFHIIDWLPTILKAVQGEIPNKINGVDLWNKILFNDKSIREEVIEIDDYTGYSAIISGKYKLVLGDTNEQYSHFYGKDLQGVIYTTPNYKTSIENSETYKILINDRKIDLDFNNIRNSLKIQCFKNYSNNCYPNKDKSCLYNIEHDPCEMLDISEDYPEIVLRLQTRLQEEWESRIPRIIPLFRDPRAKPSLHNYTWTTWLEDTNYNKCV